jgi:hypothetical protein
MLCTTGSMEHSIASHFASRSNFGIVPPLSLVIPLGAMNWIGLNVAFLYTRAEGTAGSTASGRRITVFGTNHTAVLLFASVNEQFHVPL